MAHWRALLTLLQPPEDGRNLLLEIGVRSGRTTGFTLDRPWLGLIHLLLSSKILDDLRVEE